MKKFPIFTVDAFTREPFKGNPAAVCLLLDQGEGLKDEILQKIAKEMNLSETAFVSQVPEKAPSEKSARFLLRWFTPSTEVTLCGHATMATSNVLFDYLAKKGATHVEELYFDTKFVGPLTVRKSLDGMLEMNFPQGGPVPAMQIFSPLSNNKILEFIFYDVFALDSSLYPLEKLIVDIQHCKKNRKLLVEVCCYDVIKKLNNENVSKLTSIDFGLEELNQTIKGIIVTTKGEEKFDFISRYFAPWLGIPEDPVTGSAHTVLAVYWSKKLNKKKLVALQASERSGELFLELLESSDRIMIRGHAVAVVAGEITVNE